MSENGSVYMSCEDVHFTCSLLSEQTALHATLYQQEGEQNLSLSLSLSLSLPLSFNQKEYQAYCILPFDEVQGQTVEDADIFTSQTDCW